MIPTRTFLAGVFVVLLFLLPAPFHADRVHAAPCDNSQAESLIPRNEKGKPLMPWEIQDNEEIMAKLKDACRLTVEDIGRCLENNERLKNHVIDFDRYVEAWKELKDSKRALLIQDSVLWSFREEGQVNLAKFTKKPQEANEKVTHVLARKIDWQNVTIGPSFSSKEIEFQLMTTFVVSRFPKKASFLNATFGDIASFAGATFGDDVSFAGATFDNDHSSAGGGRSSSGFPDFSRILSRAVRAFEAPFFLATFGDNANFSEAIFDDDTNFSLATFGNNADFSEATFGNPPAFSEATGDIPESLPESPYGDKASFYRTTFGNNVDFSEAFFDDDVSFDKAKFGRDASFAGTSFCYPASFSQATFGNYASFAEAFFDDDASFGRTTFGNYASFAEAFFDNNASFPEATFAEDVGLRHTIVKGKLDLGNTNWAGRADFREAIIQDLSWDNTNRPSNVKGILDARGAKFKSVVMKEIRFFDLVDFSDVEFGRLGTISLVKDKTKIDSCRREASEHPAEQSEQKTEDFGQETKVAIFQKLIFEKEVDFLRAIFRNDAIFVRNRFLGAWDLTDVKFQRKEGQVEKRGREKVGDQEEEKKNPHLCLSFNRIDKLFMEREHLGYDSSWSAYFFPDLLPLTALKKSRIRGVIGDGSYSCSDFLHEWRRKSKSVAAVDGSQEENKSGKKNEELSEIYMTIESSFQTTNDRPAENEAWYLQKVAEQENQYSEVEDSEFLSAVEYWGSLIFLNFPSRYGIDLYRVVLVSVCFKLFFAIFYTYYFRRQIRINKRKQYVQLRPRPDQKRAFRFRPFERFFQSWEKQWRPLHPWKDALFLSGRAFFKLGLGTAYPRTRMLVGITSVEWIVGMFMLIHFLVAVKNTLPIAVPFLAVAG